ncbi:MAG TPA: IS66 family transposase [Thermoanaerobaculia bacterium]|nr:IS66 family transposase [Thermoanaerobaculia bacterium]
MLREVALLLEKEVRRLRRVNREQLAVIDHFQGRDSGLELQIELDYLKIVLAQRERALFGSSSEKRSGPDTTPRHREPQKGHGPSEQLKLPVVDVPHELKETERTCPACSGQLEEWSDQHEVSEEITVVERHFVLTRHLRKKYRCRCNAAVVTAPGPLKLIPGGRYSAAFAVDVAINKYLDHLPLERQCRVMEREGLTITSQTLWDQLNALARVLEPTYEALGQRILAELVVHADETRWRFSGRGETKTHWVWCLTSSSVAFYRILASRSKDAASTMLDQYEGSVVADGYGAYQALARAGPGFTLAHCWAHARRKLVEIEGDFPELTGEILDLIGELYAIERTVPAANAEESEEEAAARLELRTQLRQERSRPVLERIRTWAEAQDELPRSGLGEAVRYLLGLWPGLTRFLEDPHIPLDNNPAERALRGIVVGRKNHYGSRSRRGCQVAALFYTLCETAKLRAIEPRAYLLRATANALKEPGAVTYP